MSAQLRSRTLTVSVCCWNADRFELTGQGKLLGGVLTDGLEQLVQAGGVMLQEK